MTLTHQLSPPQDTRRGQNNADGFGIGFYTDPKLGAAPCLFTSTIPAWNCTNLQRIASKTASHLIFAHVRATTEGSLSEDNCHPFCHGSLMWMHNGGLGGWKHIKRRLGERLADKWYLGVVGGTDSEWAFALFLDTLQRMGHDPSSQRPEGFGPTVLRRAMLKTIAIINELIDQIPQSVIHAENVDTRSLLNFSVADGHSIICTRYVSSSSDEAASLYYSSGTQWESRAPSTDDQNFQMARRDKGADIVLVASEPLTFERGKIRPIGGGGLANRVSDMLTENWVNVPTNSILTIHNQTVMVHPIADKYWNRDPRHRRSAAYVQTKGLAANEKSATTRTGTPLATPAIDLETHRRYMSPIIPFATSTRSRTPETSNLSRTQTHSSSESSSLPPDVRSITAPPVVRSSQQAPSQGNIKKKRASLSAIDTTQAGSASTVAANAASHQEQEAHSPVTPDLPRTEYGNPNKIAQFFPELTLSQ